jgi:hypothetical protein
LLQSLVQTLPTQGLNVSCPKDWDLENLCSALSSMGLAALVVLQHFEQQMSSFSALHIRASQPGLLWLRAKSHLFLSEES